MYKQSFRLVHRQELQKAHPELFKNVIQDNSSPGSGQHIAVILFWGSIIVLIALSIRSKFKKKDWRKASVSPSHRPVNSVIGLENDITGIWKLVKGQVVFSNPHTIDYSCNNIVYHFQPNGKLIINSDQDIL